MTRIAAGVLALALVCAAAGCTAAVAGVPAASVRPAPTSTRQAPSSTPDLAASIDPCALLTATDIVRLDVVSNGRDTAAGGRACSWHSRAAYYTVGIEVWDKATFGQLSRTGRAFTPYPVGSHDGRQVQDILNGGCGVFLKIDATALISVSVGNVGEECALADQFAVLIEPRLPRGDR
jgi:hypothetical protein